MAEPLLRIEALEVKFTVNERKVPVLEGVSYEIRPGETVCLVGESGCGKTVSGLSIMGLIPSPPGEISAGKIIFKGKDLLNMSPQQLQTIRGAKISMVFQEPMTSLNPVLSIGEQIGEVLAIHKHMTQEEIRIRTIQLLNDVGIPSPEERLNDYPHQLSGGQRQRVMIAMALACEPDLVIADEPTTALDVTVQSQILKLFQKLKERKNMSILYISHDLRVVSAIADRIYIMYSGMIFEHGPADKILREPVHPYTRGLFESLPDVSQKQSPLKSIPGSVPDPANRPPGCPFHPRCSESKDECKRRIPELIKLGDDREVRCPVVLGV